LQSGDFTNYVPRTGPAGVVSVMGMLRQLGPVLVLAAALVQVEIDLDTNLNGNRQAVHPCW
jgi:hypothetical protein